MAFGMQDATSDGDSEVMNEINMTPLVDVMLVLLIIFIITVPVMKHAVNVELPTATSQPQNTKPETLQLSVDAQGAYFLNQNAVAVDTLPAVLQAEAAKDPQPELHIRGDKAVRYEFVAQAMAAAQHAGLRKIGFITEPKN
ncbi:biopolymer transporter ExbD [Rhodoferax saidenbachensis]|uniref:Biopolymer transport protein ExbD n=1 Tax=Rhodoferax saidenbachensis TaxID=1484693 RepID=A0ABU1ZI14_9BURK|nr:biopolymer transporter ExbD [Rhodoferax saidenbachensis]MDR7305013.1 biopolymer transport protein ExbD [Rhodoferax saidenbachensis]